MCDRLVRPDLARNGAPHPRQAVHGACSRVRKSGMHWIKTVRKNAENFSIWEFPIGNESIFGIDLGTSTSDENPLESLDVTTCCLAVL